MKPSNELFLLIQSLTKPEKGYFKKFAGRHKKDGNNYLKLFNALNDQVVYDEAAIVKRLKNEPFIKQIRFYKNYLYSLILKSLVAFHSDSNSTGKIYTLIRMAEILRNKGILGKAGKILQEAKSLALKYDKHSLFQEIAFLELGYSDKISVRDAKALEKIHAIYHEQLEALEKLKLQIENRHNASYVYVAACFNGNLPKDKRMSKEEAIKIIEAMEKKENSKYSTFESKRNLYYIGGLLFSTIGGRAEKSDKYLKKIIDLFDENPHYIKDRIRIYIEQVTSYMSTSLSAGNLKNYKEAKTKLCALQNSIQEAENSEYIKLKIDLSIFTYDLYYYSITCQFEKVNEIISELTKKNILKKTGKETMELYGNFFYPMRVQMILDIGCMFFYCADYQNALKWHRILWNDKQDRLLYHEVYFSAIISIVCHYEMGNINSMNYLISTIIKSVNKFDHYEKFEKTFCSFMIRLVECKNKAQKKEVLKSMKQAIMPYEFIIEEFGTFNLLLWIESKIEERPAADLMREHFKKMKIK